MDLESQILHSLARKSKTTTTLQLEFSALGDRQEASVYLNGLYRAGKVKREPKGFWRITRKGMEVNGVTTGLSPGQIDVAGKDEVKADRLSVIGETAKSINQEQKPEPEPEEQKPVAKEPAKQEKLTDSVVQEAVTILKNTLQDGCALVISNNEAIAVFEKMQFQVNDAEDLDAFVRLSKRYMGKVA